MYQNSFIEYIQFERRFSPHTVVAYKTDLQQFLHYLEAEYTINNIKEVNYHIVRSWIVSLMEKNINPRSIKRKITTLKTFYNYLLREGILLETPMLKIQTPKTSKRIPVFVDKIKMDTLLDDVSFGEGFEAVRDKLILEMFYATGIRLSELINLKHSDIDIYNATIKVLGKRNKERIIPFSKVLKLAIDDYNTEKNRILTSIVNDWFFLTSLGKKLYPKLVYRIVNYYLNIVTTSDRKSPHILRHTFATHMLNNGADLNAIKELLGHANLSATQIYAHNTIEKLKNIHTQAHPKA